MGNERDPMRPCIFAVSALSAGEGAGEVAALDKEHNVLWDTA